MSKSDLATSEQQNYTNHMDSTLVNQTIKLNAA